MRGYAYSNLAAAFSRWVAALLTTVAFLLVPGGANVAHAGLSWLLFGDATAPAFVPDGEDPIAYLILLVVFGIALVVARLVTGSLWTAVGMHLTFLLVNRVTFFGEPEVTGWAAEPTHPDAILLVPGYLIVTAGTFLLLARTRRWSRRAWHGGPGSV